MIVKYYKDGVWGYIDNVRQVGNKPIGHEALIKQYDEEVKEGKRDDVASYMDFGGDLAPSPREELPLDVAKVNKTFLMITEGLPEEIKDEGYHAENLLDAYLLAENLPVNIILLYLNDHKEYDNLVLITNQKCYLMNDKGQTIERLV
jgi:hypothetical protein